MLTLLLCGVLGLGTVSDGPDPNSIDGPDSASAGLIAADGGDQAGAESRDANRDTKPRYVLASTSDAVGAPYVVDSDPQRIASNLTGGVSAIVAGDRGANQPTEADSTTANALTEADLRDIPEAGDHLEVLLAAVSVNSKPRGDYFLLWNGSDEFYFTAEALESWRIQSQYGAPVKRNGRIYYPMRALDGAVVEYNPRTVSLDVAIPAALLERSQISLGRTSPTPTAGIGAYLDYNLSYGDFGNRFMTGLLAPTFFGSWGNLDNNFVYRGRSGDSTGTNVEDGWVRLNSTFTRDDPDKMRSYRAGDIFTAPGPWGSAQYMGGLQVASNFGTQPSFVTFPTPTLNGQTKTPSMVDLYINGALRHRQEIDGGQFQIDNIPTQLGEGQLGVVVTDMLGNERIYSQDFYTSDSLLRQGLSQYSYSLGLLRENVGTQHSAYNDAAFIGAHRYGLGDRLTIGGRFELGADVVLGGGSSDWALHRGGVVSSGLAFSNGDHDFGGMWLLGYEFRNDVFRAHAQATGASEAFQTVGTDILGARPKVQMLVSSGWSLGYNGAIGLSLAHQSFHDRDDRNILTVTHNRSVADNYALALHSSVVSDGETDFSIGMTISKSFGEGRSVSSEVRYSAERTLARMETRKNVPFGPGMGYRMAATVSDGVEFDGTVIGQTRTGSYTLDAAHYDGDTSWRAEAEGSVAWMGGKPYLAREIRDGFAIADVGDFENVRVYLDNNEVGRTDAAGRVLLPALRPYQANRVRIESEDLPLNVQVSAIEIEVAPYSNSGTIAEFPVSESRAVLLRAYLPGGEAVQAGSVARIEGRDEDFLVGLNGMVYVTGIEKPETLNIYWADGGCSLQVSVPDGDHPLPQLGDLECTPLGE